MKTSPAPWVPRTGTRGTTQILDARGFLVAIVRTSTTRWSKGRDVYEGDPEGIANGRLIRLAPDLVNLLTELAAKVSPEDAARVEALLEEIR